MRKGFNMSIKWKDLLLMLIEWLPKLWLWLSTRRFRQVFGQDAGKEYHIIYCNKFVQNKKEVFISPPSKLRRPLLAHPTNLTSVNSCATTRAIGHLVYSFGQKVKVPPTLSSEVDTDEKIDISFVSIGGITNRKTCDLLEDVSHFLEFSGNSIVFATTTLETAHNEVDYAFIIKTHPQSNPERTWLCCAGVGECGASGAAWYLATKWNNIRKWAKNRPFAIITETHVNSDESTRLVHKFVQHKGASEFTKLT